MNAPAAPEFTRLMALEELSQRIEQTLGAAMPLDFLPGVARATLFELFGTMERNGYAIGAPFRGYPTARLGFQEWRVKLQRHDIECELAFFIPESA